MIIQCPDCQTRFQLDPERVPQRSIRVRCSKCRYVFGVDGSVLHAEHAAPSAASAPAPEPAARPSAPSAPVHEMGGFDAPADSLDSAPSAPAPPTGSPEEASAGFGLELERSELSSIGSEPDAAPEIELESPNSTATATVEETPQPATEAPSSPSPAAEADPKQKKARRLARALVSDILVYNRETRDRALADGTLVQALGQEIKKSWELYKEKVDPEFATDSNLFRDALNDILADGQRIF